MSFMGVANAFRHVRVWNGSSTHSTLVHKTSIPMILYIMEFALNFDKSLAFNIQKLQLEVCYTAIAVS